MYSIRVDAESNQLLVSLSGRVSTNEALRAISQAFTLAEAGNILGISCDTSELRRGPGGAVLVGTALAARYRTGMRIAIVGNGVRRAFAERIARYSRISENGIAAFETSEEARAWLAPALRRTPRLSGTEMRHVERLSAGTIAQPVKRSAAGKRAEPAA